MTMGIRRNRRVTRNPRRIKRTKKVKPLKKSKKSRIRRQIFLIQKMNFPGTPEESVSFKIPKFLCFQMTI